MTRKHMPDAESRNVNIKEQLSLLSLLVFFVGIVSTEAYYAAFNVKYQTLGLPVFHIIYRGLTAIFNNWYILGIYILAAVWLAVQDTIVEAVSRRHNAVSSILPYLFVGFVVAANYPLARLSGDIAARADMYEATCTLPKIIAITKRGCEAKKELEAKKERNSLCKNYSAYRLLGTDGSYLILFQPLEPDYKEAVPNITRLKKEEADVIQTSVK